MFLNRSSALIKVKRLAIIHGRVTVQDCSYFLACAVSLPLRLLTCLVHIARGNNPGMLQIAGQPLPFLQILIRHLDSPQVLPAIVEKCGRLLEWVRERLPKWMTATFLLLRLILKSRRNWTCSAN